MKPQFTTTLFALLTSLLATPWSGASPAGLTQKRFLDAARDRPVWVDLWYPAGETAGEERVFNGLGFADVAVDAALAPTRTPYPVVVLSHGANGSAVDYSWLATHLARHGYLVAGVSHHGESWRYGAETVDPQGLLRTWLRPEDVSFALDRLFETDPFATAADRNRIAAIGHSSGGATVLDLGGGLSNPMAMGAYCAGDASIGDRGCQYARELGIVMRPAEYARSQRDPRIRALVALDPALGPSYDVESLADIPVPTLIVGAVDNDFLPFESHAGRIAAAMPGAESIELDEGEGHFVFLDVCQSNLDANGVPLCRDRTDVDRDAAHESLAAEILRFLGEAMPPDSHAATDRTPSDTRRVMTLVEDPDDPRVADVLEAFRFWKHSLAELGLQDPFGEVEIVAADDRSIENYAWIISRGAGRHVDGAAAPLVPAALTNLDAEVVVLLSKHPLMPFAWPFEPGRHLVAIPVTGTTRIPSPTLDVVAHEIGHTLELVHQDDPRLLMCHPCESGVANDDAPRPLSEADHQILIRTLSPAGVTTPR